MKNKFKSIDGAVRRIRELEKIVESYEGIATRFKNDRNLMAKLAADGPTFYDSFAAMAAKIRRDEILKEMGLAPDGNTNKFDASGPSVPR